MKNLDRDERNRFIDEFYILIKKSTDANRLDDIAGKELQSALAIIKNISSMDDNSKEVMTSAIKKLVKSNSEARKKVGVRKQIKKKLKKITANRKIL